MSNWRRVGQSVVCIDDQLLYASGGEWMGTAVRGQVYVIREIKWAHIALFRFVGHCWLNPFGEEMWEPDFHFRPVINPEADLAEFEAILRGVERRGAERELVEA